MKITDKSNIQFYRTLASKKSQNMCVRRILKDIKQLESLKVPLANIAVKPSENDLCVWHGNIRGPSDTYWDKKVYSFTINIPK